MGEGEREDGGGGKWVDEGVRGRGGERGKGERRGNGVKGRRGWRRKGGRVEIEFIC